jgi:hypothetical protein
MFKRKINELREEDMYYAGKVWQKRDKTERGSRQKNKGKIVEGGKEHQTKSQTEEERAFYWG